MCTNRDSNPEPCGLACRSTIELLVLPLRFRCLEMSEKPVTLIRIPVHVPYVFLVRYLPNRIISKEACIFKM